MAVYLLNTYDPRGENIVLHEDRYLRHIRTRHVSVTVAGIRRAVEDPEIITRDVDYPTRDNYYARGADESFPQAFLKVCVAFDGDYGRVVTAFVVDRPKPEEEIIWSK